VTRRDALRAARSRLHVVLLFAYLVTLQEMYCVPILLEPILCISIF